MPVDIYSAWLEITEQCNLKCPYCYMDANARRQMISEEQYLHCLNVFSSLGVRNLILSGGEPFLHPLILEFIQIASKKGFIVGIATNGICIDELTIKCLVENNVFVQVSIDSLDHESYIKSRGIDRINDLTHNIVKLCKNDIDVSFSSVLSDDTKSSVLAVCDYAASIGVGTLHFGVLIPSERCKRCEMKLSNLYEVLLDLYHYQLTHIYSVQIDVIEEAVKRLIFQNDNECSFYCRAMEGCAIQVDSCGNASQCGLITSNILNIYDSSIDFITLYRDNLSPITIDNFDDCKSCIVKHICLGGCRACSFLSCNDITGRNPYCSDYFKFFTTIVKDYNNGLLDEYIRYLKIVCQGDKRISAF